MTTVTLDADTATRRAEQPSTTRADAGAAEQTPSRVPWTELSMSERELFRQIVGYRPAPALRRRRWGYPPGTRMMGRSLLCSLTGRRQSTVSRLTRRLAKCGWLRIVRHPRRQDDDGMWTSLDVQGYLPLAAPPKPAARTRPKVTGGGISAGRTDLSLSAGHPFQGSRRGGLPARPPAPTCVHGVVIGDRFAVDGTSVGGGCFVCESLRVARAATGPPDGARRPAPADDHVSQVLARARARVSTGDSVLDRARARARAARAGRDPYPAGPKGDPVA